MIAGLPLIAHTLKQAALSGLFDAIVVSSDDEAILAAGRRYGATMAVKRPAEMASDAASKIPAIMHAVEQAEATSSKFDVVTDLDATSPLRTVDDVHAAVELLETTSATNVITACVARRSPYFNLIERRPDGYVELSKPGAVYIHRRQDSPECFDMNASIYVWWRSELFEKRGVFLEQTALYQMPPERSIDIDSPLDFEFVEFLMERNKK